MLFRWVHLLSTWRKWRLTGWLMQDQSVACHALHTSKPYYALRDDLDQYIVGCRKRTPSKWRGSPITSAGYRIQAHRRWPNLRRLIGGKLRRYFRPVSPHFWVFYKFRWFEIDLNEMLTTFVLILEQDVLSQRLVQFSPRCQLATSIYLPSFHFRQGSIEVGAKEE